MFQLVLIMITLVGAVVLSFLLTPRVIALLKRHRSRLPRLLLVGSALLAVLVLLAACNGK